MNDKFLQDYLNQSNSETRIKKLSIMREENQWIPISLANDLLCLKLSDFEKTEIVRSTSSKNNLAFEDFLTSNVGKWNQNTASAGLWEWALRSDCLLWHRTIPLSRDHLLSQRLSYTLLDLAWFGGGAKVVENFVAWEGMEDMSHTFLALLYFRALQWNIESSRLKKIASDSILSSQTSNAVPEKTLPYYLAYLYRYDYDFTKSISSQHKLSGLWSQFHGPVSDDIESEKRISRLHDLSQKKSTKKSEQDLLKNWPMIWERHKIDQSSLQWVFQELSEGRLKSLSEHSWELFSGIPSATLNEAVKSMKTEEAFLTSCNVLGNLIHVDHRKEFLDEIRNRAGQSSDPGKFVSQIPQRLSASLNASKSGKSTFDHFMQEQDKVLRNNHNVEFYSNSSIYLEIAQDDPDSKARQSFFNVVFRNGEFAKADFGDNYWGLLAKSWSNPSADILKDLSQEARQAPALYQLCFIECLKRFDGIDNAALKLLDYIRSQEEDILRTVVYALSGINTNRSIQELVAFLTRPNVSFHLQMEIAQVLQEANLSQLQAELRSAISDLKLESQDASNWELREAITTLLTVQNEEEEAKQDGGTVDPSFPTTEVLDQHLGKKIEEYKHLSGEAKRALRTAQFFHLQVETSGNLSTIDLSPAIDMQYKALELSFREKFEDSTGTLIRQGILQRKLDVIGYARPIPAAMDEFEKYIESLPIINSVPFFSRFKLRKMLRAICQFRPGKRFTLDGLKAFALFFVCFSRKQCNYGLNNLFPLPDFSDEELYQFCKELHIFQDFRNRAAHEGFHPDASNDLGGIWDDTSKIVHNMIRVENIVSSRQGKQELKTGA